MQKILIVDDDITLRMGLSRYLSNRTYSVEHASSGDEGLLAFRKYLPDLVVSDIVMPGMDGFEFCRQLRAAQGGQLVPFIFLSGQGDIEHRIQGHAIGADDYLIKPFEPRELLAKIEGQLDRSRRIQLEIERITQRIPMRLATGPNGVSMETPKPLPLTPAEIKVFWEVVQGFTNRQIGARLFISPRTVQTHLSNILSKLSLENRSQLVRYAFENNYQPPADLITKPEPDAEAQEED
jgi:DNA-binding NarL/FixJ family response regulator